MAENNLQDGFATKALDAIPKWALGTLGLFMGTVLTLQISGYNSAAIRVIEANVKKYEASATSLEYSAARLAQIASRLDGVDKEIITLKSRVQTLELHADSIDAKYHKK